MLLSIKTWIVCLILLPTPHSYRYFFGFHSPLCLMIHVFHPLNSTLWVIFCLQPPRILSGSSFILLGRLSGAPVIICTVTFSCHAFFLSFSTPAFFSGLFFCFFSFLLSCKLRWHWQGARWAGCPYCACVEGAEGIRCHLLVGMD